MRNLKLIPNISSSIPPIVDIVDQLTKKSAWEPIRKRNIVEGNWDGVTYSTGFRDPNDINTIVIHHSGPPNGSLESHARYHANKWGGGIAYHVAIDQGMIKQVNDLRSFTFHTAGHNTYTVAIMVNRDLTVNDLTAQERELLYAAILSVKAVLPITQIKGHRELSPTACPQTSENRIREDIMKAELNLALSETPNDTTAKIFTAYGRFSDLYKLATTPGKYQEEAQRKCLQIATEMEKAGILVMK